MRMMTDFTVQQNSAPLQGKQMSLNDFQLGFLIGSLIVGIITTPFLTYLGLVYLNLRKMEDRLVKETPKEIKAKVDDETLNALADADKILKENVV